MEMVPTLFLPHHLQSQKNKIKKAEKPKTTLFRFLEKKAFQYIWTGDGIRNERKQKVHFTLHDPLKFKIHFSPTGLCKGSCKKFKPQKITRSAIKVEPLSTFCQTLFSARFGLKLNQGRQRAIEAKTSQ
jgi:hypothetical protein